MPVKENHISELLDTYSELDLGSEKFVVFILLTGTATSTCSAFCFLV